MGEKPNNRQVLKRMDSLTAMRMLNKDKGFCGVCRVIVERSWSGNLGPPTINKTRPTNPKRLQHQRFQSTGKINYHEEDEEEEEEEEEEKEEARAGIMPQLMRSGGLRRDWSFENLYQNGKDWKKNQIATTMKTTPTRV